jgi:hypothetical protein
MELELQVGPVIVEFELDIALQPNSTPPLPVLLLLKDEEELTCARVEAKSKSETNNVKTTKDDVVMSMR